MSATSRPQRVLIVEDDASLAFGLKLNLEFEGLEVLVETDGLRALSLPCTFQPHLILLDLMLPRLDGFELIRQWRVNDRVTRIVVLSAKAAESDRVAGLRLGADDYVTKPFSVMELIERVRNQLRRALSINGAEARTVWLEDGCVDLMARTIRRGTMSQQFSPKEFALFNALLQADGAVMSRRVLLQRVWGHKAPVDTNTVDYHVCTLRRKLELDPGHPKHLLTVRKGGYRLQL